MELVVAHKGKKRWRCRVRGFEAHSSLTPHRRQRGADRVRDRRYHRAPCARVPRRRPPRRRLRRARTRRSTSARSTAARRSTSCRATARSSSSSATCRSTIPTRSSRGAGATPQRVPAGDARGGARTRASSSTSCRRCPASTRTTAARSPRSATRCNGTARRRQGVVRHRGVAVPQRQHPDDHLRPRPHRAGAPAQRMGDAGADRAVRGVHAPARRPASASTDGVTRRTAARRPPIEVDFPDLERWRGRQHRRRRTSGASRPSGPGRTSRSRR